MPNWCEGNIRVRGRYENVVAFLEDALETVHGEFNGKEYKTVEKPADVEMNKDNVILRSGNFKFYIKGTHRNFIDSSAIEVYDYKDNEEHVWVFDNFCATWSFSHEVSHKAYSDFAKKYNVDIKLFGIEQGMQFVEQVVYYREGNYDEETIEYDDWDFDCPFPRMGG